MYYLMLDYAALDAVAPVALLAALYCAAQPRTTLTTPPPHLSISAASNASGENAVSWPKERVAIWT